MNINSLTKLQSDAAFAAAHILMRLNPNVSADRANFRDASLKLGEMIGDDREAGKLILEAVNWIGRDFLAETLCDLPRV